MGVKFCPKCKSTQIIMVAGGQIGLWKCARCSFQSAIFPEIELNKKTKKKK